MRRGLRLGSVRGVEVVADLSLFVIATLLTWSLYADLSRAFPRQGGDMLLLASVVGGALFFGSVLIHELAHSLVAIRRGFAVHRIRLFIFGGVSEIEDEAETAADELVVTLVGPAASLALGVLFLAVGWPLSAVWMVPGRVAFILGVANLSIGVFNMLPGLPLDGGRILRAIVWRRTDDRDKATRIAVGAGKGLGVTLAAVGTVLVFLGADLTAVWLIAVGWFLYQAAAASSLQELFLTRISGLTVADVMRRTELAVDGDATVAETLQMHGWGDKLRTLPVSVDGRVLGVFGSREVRNVEEATRTTTLVRDAMTTIGPGDVVPTAATLREALRPGERGGGVLVAVEAGEVVGLITGEEVSELLAEIRRRDGSQ